MLLPLLAAITLSVSTASKSAVAIAWTGATGAVTIERKAAGAPWPTTPPPTPLATVSTASYTDQAIDQFATYTYRVKAGAVISNEVTVGPPPVGFSAVVKMPAALTTTNLGAFAAITRLTFDDNGDPAIAWITTDPNGDGDPADGQLHTIRWNRARYRWNEPVKVDDVGGVPTAGSNIPVSFARDASTGLYGLLYVVGASHEMRFASSPDGAAWTITTVIKTADEAPGFASPALALAAGRVHAAYAVGVDSVLYRTGMAAGAPAQWTTRRAPLPSPVKRVNAACVSLVLDAANQPSVGFCSPPEDGYTTSAFLWRVTPNSVSKIVDTDNHQTDDPSLALAQRGTTVVSVFGGARDDRYFHDHHFWGSVSRDGGATWSAPVAMADDGGNSMAPPVTVGIHDGLRMSAAAVVGGGTDGNVKCGQPKLMRSDNGSAWNTCAPDTRGLPGTANPSATALGVAGNDKLYIAFRTSAAAGTVPAGLVLWRER